MTNSNPNEKRGVESILNRDDPEPQAIATSLREEVDMLHACGETLAEQLDEMDTIERKTLDPQPITTDVLETANALIEVAYKLESSRVSKKYRGHSAKSGP